MKRFMVGTISIKLFQFDDQMLNCNAPQVNKATKDLDLFMRKDPPVLTMDEMRGSSALIDKYECILRRILVTRLILHQIHEPLMELDFKKERNLFKAIL